MCITGTTRKHQIENTEIGLERVAEELMGRRKWKCQDSLAQSNATDLLAKQSPSIGECFDGFLGLFPVTTTPPPTPKYFIQI